MIGLAVTNRRWDDMYCGCELIVWLEHIVMSLFPDLPFFHSPNTFAEHNNEIQDLQCSQDVGAGQRSPVITAGLQAQVAGSRAASVFISAMPSWAMSNTPHVLFQGAGLLCFSVFLLVQGSRERYHMSSRSLIL